MSEGGPVEDAPIYGPFFGVMGSTSAMVFSSLGAAYGTAKTMIDSAEAMKTATAPSEYARQARATAEAAKALASQAQTAAKAAEELASKAETEAENYPS